MGERRLGWLTQWQRNYMIGQPILLGKLKTEKGWCPYPKELPCIECPNFINETCPELEFKESTDKQGRKTFDDFLGELKTEKNPKKIEKLKRKKRKQDYYIRKSFKQAWEDFELYMRWEDKERFRQLVESTELRDVFKGEEKYILGKGFAYSENIICPSCGQQFTYSFGSPGGKKGAKGVTFGVEEKGS